MQPEEDAGEDVDGQGRDDEEGFREGGLVVGPREEEVGVGGGEGARGEGDEGDVGDVRGEEGGECVGGVALCAEDCGGRWLGLLFCGSGEVEVRGGETYATRSGSGR